MARRAVGGGANAAIAPALARQRLRKVAMGAVGVSFSLDHNLDSDGKMVSSEESDCHSNALSVPSDIDEEESAAVEKEEEKIMLEDDEEVHESEAEGIDVATEEQRMLAVALVNSVVETSGSKKGVDLNEKSPESGQENIVLGVTDGNCRNDHVVKTTTVKGIIVGSPTQSPPSTPTSESVTVSLSPTDSCISNASVTKQSCSFREKSVESKNPSPPARSSCPYALRKRKRPNPEMNSTQRGGLGHKTKFKSKGHQRTVSLSAPKSGAASNGREKQKRVVQKIMKEEQTPSLDKHVGPVPPQIVSAPAPIPPPSPSELEPSVAVKREEQEEGVANEMTAETVQESAKADTAETISEDPTPTPQSSPDLLKQPIVLQKESEQPTATQSKEEGSLQTAVTNPLVKLGGDVSAGNDVAQAVDQATLLVPVEPATNAKQQPEEATEGTVAVPAQAVVAVSSSSKQGSSVNPVSNSRRWRIFSIDIDEATGFDFDVGTVDSLNPRADMTSTNNRALSAPLPPIPTMTSTAESAKGQATIAVATQELPVDKSEAPNKGNYSDAPIAPADNSTTRATPDVPGAMGRDRGMSFDFFSFGINENEPLPPTPVLSGPPVVVDGTATPLLHPGGALVAPLAPPKEEVVEGSCPQRPRGDSIIFDPVSFSEGGIHEENALLRTRRSSIDMQENDEIALMNTPGFVEAPASCLQQASKKNKAARPPLPVVSLDNTNSQNGTPVTHNKKPGADANSGAPPCPPLAGPASAPAYPQSNGLGTLPKGADNGTHTSAAKSTPAIVTLHTTSGSALPPMTENTIHMPHGSAAAAAAQAHTLPSSPNGTSAVAHTACPMELLNKGGRIGIYLPDARKARIAKFHSKRKMRIWRKRIKYDCRKKLADSRPRIKGRFVKRSDMEDDDE